MKALSIRQPWADAIVLHGKNIENRTWPTRYRGPVLIHAGKAWGAEGKADRRWVEMTHCIAMREPVHFGGIVGRAEIVDCIEFSDCNPWFEGPFGFVMRNMEPLPFRPLKGELGFFDVDQLREVGE